MIEPSRRMLRVALLTLAAGAAAPSRAAGEARNVIFFLGNGMGPATVTATRLYQVGESGQLKMESLRRTARIKTYSNDAQTTDSAASMSAYMTGAKINNEVVSMSPDTRAADAGHQIYASGSDTRCPTGNGAPAITLLELAKRDGRGTGVVTTARVTHATTAATYAHLCHRDGENQIAQQATPGNALYNAALKDGVEVLLGGGRRHFLPQGAPDSARTDANDLITQFQAARYAYASTGAQLAAIDPAATARLLGLFSPSHMAFNLDRVRRQLDEPSLADMTEKALRILQKNTRGYFLVVEGGRIHHALHQNNAKRALEDTVAFDQAIERALSLADLSNTLMIVTANHDHTMTINGYPHRGNPILGLATRIKTRQPRLAADRMPYTTLTFGSGSATRKAVRDNPAQTDTAADDYRQDIGVQRAEGIHHETQGGGDVMLLSAGPGSASLKGTMVNTRVFDIIKTAMGL